MPVQFQVRQVKSTGSRGKKPEPTTWVTVERKGRTFQDHAGNTIEVFPTVVMGEAVGVEAKIILRWEKAGFFPRAVFGIEGEKTRWYTASQVINSHRLFLGKYGGINHKGDIRDSFFKDIKGIWYAKDVIVSEQGAI